MSDGPVPPRLLLARHGETEWSLAGRHTGRTDVALTDHGREQAADLAGALRPFRVRRVLVSPLGRAIDTCRRAGLLEGAAVCPELVEWDYGEYEGLTTAQIRSRRPDWLLWRDGCPGGEAPVDVARRADAVLAAVAGAEGDVAVFGHGHALRVLAARWIAMDAAAGARLMLDPATLSILGHERETRTILRWNDDHHLTP